jgi:hypothetical protein
MAQKTSGRSRVKRWKTARRKLRRGSLIDGAEERNLTFAVAGEKSFKSKRNFVRMVKPGGPISATFGSP